MNFNVPCFFDKSTEKSIELSGYPINKWYIVDSPEELMDKLNTKTWEDYGFERLNKIAREEKQTVLESVFKIIS